jgi:hypothetical protein
MSNSIPLSSLQGGSPAAKFEKVGDKYAGVIESMDERQQTDFSTGKPLFFESGDPRMQWVITIGTPEGDSVSLYARGGNHKPDRGSGESMLNAIGTAVLEAGANALEVGGRLAVAHTGFGEAKAGLNAPKLYTAQYQPPAAPSVAVDDLFAS